MIAGEVQRENMFFIDVEGESNGGKVGGLGHLPCLMACTGAYVPLKTRYRSTVHQLQFRMKNAVGYFLGVCPLGTVK